MLDKDNIPQHIAIIMDGNGRWAKKRGLPRVAGHRRGIETVRSIVKAAGQLGVKFLTLYAFSIENWNRPKSEVSMLMRSLDNFLKKRLKELHENGIKLNVIGRMQGLPEFVQKSLNNAMDLTKHNSRLTVNLALNYGGRQEIMDAAREIARGCQAGRMSVDNLDEDVFSQHLYTRGVPDPDLLIRTSGEQRISNFLLWQLSYAEFYFTNKLWPDFSDSDLQEAIADFQARQRRFGGIEARRR